MSKLVLLAKDFDFTKAVKHFAPALDEAHPKYSYDQPLAAALWLDMPQFPEYIAAAFSDPLFCDQLDLFFNDTVNDNKASVKVADMKLYTQFASVNFPDRNIVSPKTNGVKELGRIFPAATAPKDKKIRQQNIYPLGHDETELALDFIDKNVDYEYAMFAIKLCLLDYFSLMSRALRGAYGFDVNAEKHKAASNRQLVARGYSALTSNAKDFSFLQDFMPLIANAVRQEEEAFAPKSLHSAFAQAFKRHAFKSVNEAGMYKKCPFAQALVKLMSIEITPNDNQDDFTIRENAYPGALIASARDHVRRVFAQSMPQGHAVTQIRGRQLSS